MRRPLLNIFLVIISISFIYTKIESKSYFEDDTDVIIEDVLQDKKDKVKYNEYVFGEFLLRDYTKSKNLQVGDIVKVKGKFKNTNDMIYDNFDYGRYIKSLGYKGIIYIENYEVINENLIYKYLGKIKVYIRDTSRYLYKDKSDFVNSIIIGEKYNLSEYEKDIFNRTGTSHIIAISGFHTAILCTLVMVIVRGINKYLKFIILVTVIIFYCIMVGKSPSIIRAIMFTIIMYISIFIDRKRDGISSLSIIGIFLVTNNPYIIYNVSFQLSFLATLSIIYFYGYINNIIKISLISLTISANILTLPVIYYNFNGISTISILSNVIIVPFIGFIMYLSIGSIVLFNINIQIAKLISSVNKIIIETIYYFLEKLSNLYFAYIEIYNPSIYYVITYYIIVFSYMTYKEMKVMKEQKNELQGYYK